jgi:hypothetical protein
MKHPIINNLALLLTLLVFQGEGLKGQNKVETNTSVSKNNTPIQKLKPVRK